MSLTRLQNRRGLSTEWQAGNPVLAPGEIGLELDTGKFKLGDGITSWNTLEYGLASAYDVAVNNGFEGTESDWLDSLEGASAYAVAVENGFVGTESDWLNSLVGPEGPQGSSGFTYPTVVIAPATIASSDAGKVLRATSPSSSTSTINTTTAFSPGQHCVVIRDTAAEVVISAAAGVTIDSTGNRFRLDEQYSSVTILCLSSNRYVLIGDLKL